MQTSKKRREAIVRPEKANDIETVDRFTCLPNKIMNTILSFLPMKYACRTCFSSKKLTHLLTSIPNLHFGRERYDFGPEETRAPVEFVERFLEKRDAPIKSLRLQIDLKGTTFDVEHWISLLVRNGVEDLELDIWGKNEIPFDVFRTKTVRFFKRKKYELPAEMFSSETIRSSKLWSCVFRPPPSCTIWGLVETMFLGQVCGYSHFDSLLVQWI